MNILNHRLYIQESEEIYAFHIKEIKDVSYAIKFCESFNINAVITLTELPEPHEKTLDKLEIMLFAEIEEKSRIIRSYVGEVIIVHIRYYTQDDFIIKTIASFSKKEFDEIFLNPIEFISC